MNVGDSSLSIAIQPTGGRRQRNLYGSMPPLADLPASTPLTFGLRPDCVGGFAQTWSDDADGKLEGKLADMAAAVIVEGERCFRESVREAVRMADERRRAAEQARRARLAELERQRVDDLLRSGELLRQAEEIRSLVERVGSAIAAGEHKLSADEFETWRGWALGHADRLDPVRSGQVMSHLKSPAPEDA